MAGYCKECGNQHCVCSIRKVIKICLMCDEEYKEEFETCPACGTELKTEYREYEQDFKSASNIFQDEVYKALGWQGGTIHQVITEIKRLKKAESDLKNCLKL
jgi:uncharacterized protein with PIN domain